MVPPLTALSSLCIICGLALFIVWSLSSDRDSCHICGRSGRNVWMCIGDQYTTCADCYRSGRKVGKRE